MPTHRARASGRRRRFPAGRLVAASALATLLTTGLVSGGSADGADVASPSHPLDPLTAAEIDTAFEVIEEDPRFPDGAYFPIVTLEEPPKAAVLAWSPGQPIGRRAFANVYDPVTNRAIEVVVDLSAGQVVSWVPRPGVQPAVYLTEYAVADEIVRADPRWRRAMRARGIKPNDVYLDVWARGDDADAPGDPGARLMRAVSFYRGDLPNVYDRPIEGVIVTVDMNTGQVVEFVDTGIRPVNTTITGNAATERTGLTDLIVRQPDGPSFQIDGRQVVWQNWQFRVGYNPREGLVLHQIGYLDDGAVRPIIYRIGLDEIYVPYALPDENWAWRSAFDVGEYDIGQYVEDLRRLVDVPGNAVFLDETVGADTGSVDGTYALPHAVAIYEQHAGVLWDRLDPETYERDARLGRELVVTATNNIGNYTYTTAYTFRLDGTIDVRVGLTGTTLNQGVSMDADGNQFGTTVADHVAAPAHQHFFNFRIDFDVDGTANRLVEVDTVPVASPSDNAFHAHHTVLTREQSRDANAATSRAWMVESLTSRNGRGQPTAYMLTGADTTVAYSSLDYLPLQRAAFAQHPLWVTRYQPREMYAAGDYPNQGHAGDGLADYTSTPENVSNGDLVVWFTTGLTHHPVIEQYPVATTHRNGFELHPAGFFDTNPALDVPHQDGS